MVADYKFPFENAKFSLTNFVLEVIVQKLRDVTPK